MGKHIQEQNLKSINGNSLVEEGGGDVVIPIPDMNEYYTAEDTDTIIDQTVTNIDTKLDKKANTLDIYSNEYIDQTFGKVKTVNNIAPNASGNVTIPTGSGGIEEAPLDGLPYSRQDASWVKALSDVPIPGDFSYLRKPYGWEKFEGILTDSPEGGQTYGRINGSWTSISGILNSKLDRNEADILYGKVKSVESTSPDDLGNVVIPSMVKKPTLNITEAKAYKNGDWVDLSSELGNTFLTRFEASNTYGKVKTVNNVAPDASGNVDVTASVSTGYGINDFYGTLELGRAGWEEGLFQNHIYNDNPKQSLKFTTGANDPETNLNIRNEFTLKPTGFFVSQIGVEGSQSGGGSFYLDGNEFGVYSGLGSLKLNQQSERRGLLNLENSSFNITKQVGEEVLTSLKENGDLEFMENSIGIIMKSPNGTKYKLSVSDTGEPVFTKF